MRALKTVELALEAVGGNGQSQVYCIRLWHLSLNPDAKAVMLKYIKKVHAGPQACLDVGWNEGRGAEDECLEQSYGIRSAGLEVNVLLLTTWETLPSCVQVSDSRLQTHSFSQR